MRATSRIVLAGIVASMLGLAPAHASEGPCAGRYVVDEAHTPLLTGAQTPGYDLVVLSKSSVEIGSGCSPIQGTLRPTRRGWAVRARWNQCGRYRRVRLKASLDAGCRIMRGQVRGKRRLHTRFAALLAQCGASNEPATFASTWEAIQARIFERHGCTNDACHGSAASGGLDLRPAAAYRSLVDRPASAAPLDRVEPGDRSRSFLWLKLAKATLPDQYGDVALAGMPFAGAPLSPDELEAVRLWIQYGAPERGVVPDTDQLLATSLGAAAAGKIRPSPPPPPDQGVQLKAAPWPIPARDPRCRNGEDEVCFATWYDFSAEIPDWATFPCDPYWGAGRTCFGISRSELTQDPNSHHSIIHYYKGRYDVADPLAGFGPFTCRGGERDAQPCDPTNPASCGSGGECAGRVVSSVNCIGYGPDDASDGFSANLPIIGGSQQPHAEQHYPDGVFASLPVSGVIVWNSHAFNVTDQPTTNEQYLNLYFARPEQRQTYVRAIFDLKDIFVQQVPPFAAREYCSTHTLPKGARVFELSSHTHRRGRFFRVWGPGIMPCRPGPDCTPESGPPLLATTDYSDPAVYRYAEPLALDGDDPASRTYKYCAMYDNGHDDPATVKRRSTSPPPPMAIGLGGPCSDADVVCASGPRRGMPCGGDHARCGGRKGAGDGVCDACPLTGGVTTEDEMFILIGSGYCAPGSECESSAEF